MNETVGSLRAYALKQARVLRVLRSVKSQGQADAYQDMGDRLIELEQINEAHEMLVQKTMKAKIQELWNTFSSQELFGEALRETAPELFEELDTAISASAKREPLVLEVIRLMNDRMASMEMLRDACRKLAEWKP
jgi:hypothetical protein